MKNAYTHSQLLKYLIVVGLHFFQSVNQKYDQSCDLLDSFILSQAESNEIESCTASNLENSLDYFMVYEQSIQVYFNRVR